MRTALNSYHKQCIKHNIEPNINFEKWINNVEIIVYQKLKLNLLDIPDEDYMINFEENISYNQMAKYIINQYNIN